MKVLVIYATIEGQTGNIARFVADEVKDGGHEVEMADASDITADIRFASADRVILAASVHERRHPKEFEMLLAARRDRLEEADTLLISVSLMAAFPDTLEEAREFVTEMIRAHVAELRDIGIPDLSAKILLYVMNGRREPDIGRTPSGRDLDRYAGVELIQ